MDQAEKLRSMVKSQGETGQTQSKKLARVITVTSGKGGVGKSSIAINLAMQFRKKGKSVIIFDADFGLANIEVMFGAIPKYNLADMIFRGKNFKDIIVEGPEGIGFISGGSGINGLGNMNREQVQYLVYKLKELETLADVIIIDTGAGISDSVLEFVSSSGEVVLVTTPEPTSITDSYALLKALNARESFDKEICKIKVVANRVSNFDEGKNLFSKLEVVVSKFLQLDLMFLGVVPMDMNMSKSVMQQKPISMLYPNSTGAKAIEQIAVGLLENKEAEGPRRNGLARAVANIIKNGFKK
ncbi:MAG: MinD/ParA family protein [Lachnospiraceae bacterium]|nr:MinD/ParA family protein [Lachnospiraceae bacterium]MEE0685880.1 MinD/ParA family protein [Lachnospiraceae bacterium]